MQLPSGLVGRVANATRPLRDSFNRAHDYLRMSLTERCNLRCRYCMPAEGITLTDKRDCLSLDELKHLTNLFVKSCGVKKIRLTGGEPTLDRKLVPILEHLKTLRPSGLETVGLTTNGLTLGKNVALYKELGLNMVNVSLDTLRPERFEQMARRRGWHLVHAALASACELNFNRVKLNCVVMRDFNLDELADFARLALERPIEVRFIEFMPFQGNKWNARTLVPFSEMLATLRASMPRLAAHGATETSKVYWQPGMRGSVGFISSMTDNFCCDCNRLRLTADGNLRVCLFGKQETSLRDLLRNGARDAEIVRAIQSALAGKRRQHAGMSMLQRDVSRPMIKIGG